jgi:hypothetical protein
MWSLVEILINGKTFGKLSIPVKCRLRRNRNLAVLNTFGNKPSDIYEDSMASNRTISIGFSRSANGA